MSISEHDFENQKTEEPFGLGCAFKSFSEHEEIFKIIDNLKILVDSERSIREKTYEKFSFILGQYIEQPHLIDSHINELLEKFIAIVRNSDNSIVLKHLAFKFMFVVVNVRGYKVVVRHLPHEVADLEPVLQLLERQDPTDPDTWTTRYILLLWLSIIVIIPFHMSRFDGFDQKDAKKETVMDRILTVIKRYAVVSDKCRDAAAYLSHKFITRCLTFLPPRIASWRYKRGQRSLAVNLSSGDGSVAKTSDEGEDQQENEEDIEVPDEMEEIIDQLIHGLRSSDGVVRWSAAKGIGRVSGRLPKELADDVVGSVLEEFNSRDSDGWHGGCLALAELGRRGLLLPERLPEVVPVVLKALVFDEPRGSSSVGSHIRDAACYDCWSFSRAYESHVLQPYVNEIASTLLVVACFDKEINCRRAASAAFQENVGRQGTCPHGIEIQMKADFSSVSVRTHAYLNISTFIAQFEEYTESLISHLLTRKVDHWDSNIRELTAKALHNLTPKLPEYMINKALPALFDRTNSIDLNSRHGAVLAIGEIFHSLSKTAKESCMKLESLLKEDLLDKTKKLILTFREKMYFRGLGGELMRRACCDFIEKCSLASMPFHNETIIQDWHNLLNECLSCDVLSIRTVALIALPALLEEYYCDKPEEYDKVVKFYVKELLCASNEHSRMGYSLALGALPKLILKPQLDLVVSSLIESTAITPTSLQWAESRRDAIKALTSIAVVSEGDMDNENIGKIYHTFLEGLKDYTQDKRGDIGAWVREACISGLQIMTCLVEKFSVGFLTPNLLNQILSGIAQQAVEKIDRTRALAGRVFYSLIYSNTMIKSFTYYSDLCRIFPKEECEEMNWNSASVTFPKFVQLIQLPPFTYNIILGLVCSVGGMTETLVKNSSSSLFTYLKSEVDVKGLPEIQRICDIILKIFIEHQKIDRITVSMFRFLDKLFDSGCIELIMADSNSEFEFIKKTLKLIQVEIAGCKDIYKLIDGITVLCQYIQVKGEVCDIALVQLSILLCHRQPYIRRTTSNKLYESLLVNGESSNISSENIDDVMNLLSGTDWEKPVEDVRPVRNQLCNLMGVKVPVTVKKKI
nr:tubulin-specific chaperone D [Leptinotarsa decemlineata]